MTAVMLALACASRAPTAPAEAPPVEEPVTVAAEAPDTKRGVAYHFCGWDFAEGAADLDALRPGISWYYNWSSGPLACPDGKAVGDALGAVEFVPMAWGLVDGGQGCESGGPCFLVDERAGGMECPAICEEVGWSFDAEGPCYACYHQPVSRQDFLDDVPATARHLLGYNEPNFKEQANLTPEQAATGWTHVEWVADQRDLALVGPATNFCDPTPGAKHPGACIEAVDGHRMLGLAWLERFYDACTAEGAAGFDCRIDQQAVHAYSCGGVTWMIELMKGKAGLKTPDAEHCSNGVQDEDEFGTDCGGNFCTACSAHARTQFAKPVWLTEFGTPSGDCGLVDEAALIDKTAAFMRQELPALDADPYVYRYAWFMPKTDISTLTHGDLLIEDRAGERTALGELYLAPPESP